MLELVAGIGIAIACLALVLEPLVRPSAAVAETADPDWSDFDESDTPKVKALQALSEIEFDLATGKLAQEDYKKLKSRYGREALAAIEAEQQVDEDDEPDAGSPGDAAEEAIRRAKRASPDSCPVCAGRLEPGAAFCTDCGCSVFSADPRPRCATCGSSLSDGVKFCGDCGAPAKAVPTG